MKKVSWHSKRNLGEVYLTYQGQRCEMALSEQINELVKCTSGYSLGLLSDGHPVCPLEGSCVILKLSNLLFLCAALEL